MVERTEPCNSQHRQEGLPTCWHGYEMVKAAIRDGMGEIHGSGCRHDGLILADNCYEGV